MAITFSERLRKILTEEGELYLPKAKTPLLAEKRAKKIKNGYLVLADVAEIVGASTQAVTKWQAASVTPKMQYIKKLSDAYDVSVEWLLGQTNAPNLRAERGYQPFKELGFSYKAYDNLVKLKAQGTCMEDALQGLNFMLEHCTYPYAWMEEDALNLDKADIEQEKKDSVLAQRKMMVKEIEMPILNYLNRFFDLFENGIYAQIPISVADKLCDESESSKPALRKNLYNHLVNPAINDGAALFAIEVALKERKKQLVEEALTKMEKETEDENAVGMDTLPVDFRCTQEHALRLLQDFYSPETD